MCCLMPGSDDTSLWKARGCVGAQNASAATAGRSTLPSARRCETSRLLHYTLRLDPVRGSVDASQKMMRLGVMRINAELMLGEMDCPPSATTSADPRISRLRVFHGGN